MHPGVKLLRDFNLHTKIFRGYEHDITVSDNPGEPDNNNRCDLDDRYFQ
jgi:hypothetical protein